MNKILLKCYIISSGDKMKFLNILKSIQQNRKLITFYLLIASTFTVAFVSTGKNINVYSQPLPIASVRYDTTKIFVPSKKAYDFLSQLTKQMDELVAEIESNEADFEVKEVNQSETNTASFDIRLPVGLPVNGSITSPFGDTEDRSSPHKGVDIGVSVGTPVRCTGSGTVVMAQYSNSYGYVVEVDHGNGYQTLYAHNAQLTVEEGDYVAQGDIVALSGNTGDSTGPHVHYEMSYDGNIMDPLSN